MCLEVRPEGWHRSFASLLGVLLKEACAVPCFCSQHCVLKALQKWQLGLFGYYYHYYYLVFLCLLSRISPAVHACTYFYSVIAPSILLPGETFVQAQALQEGSRFHPVSVLFLVQKGRSSYRRRFLLRCKRF